jgi:hypothetical protein
MEVEFYQQVNPFEISFNCFGRKQLQHEWPFKVLAIF